MNLYDLSSPFIAAIKGGVAAQGVKIATVTKEPSLALQPGQIAAIEKLVQSVNNSTFAAGNWEISLDVIGQGRHPVV